MAKKKLGILLSTSSNENFETVLVLTQEALQQDVLVYLYFIDDGVTHLNRSEMHPLSDAGVNLFACAYGAERRGVPQNDFVVFSGLVTLADIIKGCDQFLSFPPTGGGEDDCCRSL
ncbi:MAG: DsrE family protein [Nitrospirota bacterium]